MFAQQGAVLPILHNKSFQYSVYWEMPHTLRVNARNGLKADIISREPQHLRFILPITEIDSR